MSDVHKIGDLVYHVTTGLGWITKIYDLRYTTKPYYIEWMNPTPRYLKDLEYYSAFDVSTMKQMLANKLG